MAPSSRVVKAFRAMKAIGISESKVKPVLKRLLKLYEKNWDLIEEENYRALADAIFEEEDIETSGKKPNENVEESLEEDNVADEPERPLKRLRKKNEEHESTNNNNRTAGMLLKVPKEEEQELPTANSLHESTAVKGSQISSSPPQNLSIADNVSPRIRHSYKGKEPLLEEVSPKEKRRRLQKASHALQIRDPVSDSAMVLHKKVLDTPLLIKPKDEPITDDMPLNAEPMIIEDSSAKSLKMSTGKEPLSSNCEAEQENGDNRPASLNETRGNNDLAIIPGGSTANLEIASSRSGEVKLSLSCNSLFRRPNFRMPSQDELLKSMQEKCLRSYKILDPNFSVMKMLKDICECFLELGTDTSDQSQESPMNVTPTVDVLKKSVASSVLGFGCSEENNLKHAQNSNGSVNKFCVDEVALPIVLRVHTDLEDKQSSQEVIAAVATVSDEVKDLSDPGLGSLVVVPDSQLTFGHLSAIHNVSDLTKGEELVEIPWFNERNNDHPPYFNYIPKSLIFQNAYVNFTLSHIGVDYCCSTCFGDCLASPTPCACANETGYLFAYSPNGLVKGDFLEKCVSMTRDPQQQSLYYCGCCLLEISKNEDVIEPCKGHLKRKYINECWSKCGCNKQCGNRVVQRGIRCKLQVFFTKEGKGWGLRTLEKLPKGAFVCEYVGEILTAKEFYERNVERTSGTDHKSQTYPVVLDALWFLKEVQQEKEALCLDASNYGNVARFINHRCLDANLIEIPVKIESTDNHYYHLAFFTTREVEALEELTWDYGIEFGDGDNAIEAFRCLCHSKFCRDMRRSNRLKYLSS